MRDLVRFLHSRYGYLLMVLMAVSATVFAYVAGCVVAFPNENLIGLKPVCQWFGSSVMSLVLALVVTVGISMLLVYVDKHYTIIKGMSLLYAGLFLIMVAAVPSMSGAFYGGNLLALMIIAAVIPLFSAYQKPRLTRRIFLAFFLVTVASLLTLAYTAIGFLAVFFVGCGQMRCTGVRPMLAALTGVLTPLWILWGFGIVDFGSLYLVPPTWGLPDLPQGMLSPMLVYLVLTLVVGFFLGGFNLIKIFNYNSRARAFNGFLSLLSLMTFLLMVIDLSHIPVYLPILAMITAYQAGHFFTINNQKGSYIPILAIILLYSAIYVWIVMEHSLVAS